MSASIDEFAELLARRNLNFEFLLAILEFLGEHLLVGADAGFALGLPRLGGEADPFQLAVQGFLPRRGGLLLALEPLLLLLEPRAVVSFPGDAAAAIEFQNPAGHIVEKIAIVGHGHDGARVFVQMPLEPGDALGVEMVRRLVEQQQIGPFEQNLAQRHPPPLAAGELPHVGVAGRQIHRLHRDFDLPVEFPSVQQLDLILHAGLLGQQFVHPVGFERLAEPGVDLVESLEDGRGVGDGVLDVPQHVLGRIERAAPARDSRR